MSVSPKQAVAALVTLIAVMLAFLVGVTIIDGVGTAAGPAELTDKRSSPLITIDEYVSFQDTSLFAGQITQVYRVNDSTGQAIRLRGARDSEYESDASVAFAGDSTWSISSWQAWNSSYGTTNGTVYSLNGRVILQYDNSSQQWIGWYYNESSTNSYRVNVSATSQPGTLRHITLVKNASAFTIYRNNTRGEVEQVGVASSEDPLLDASNWAGRQEELRGFDDALNTSERQSLIDSPVRPLSGANRTFRVMFDQGSGSSEPVYFSQAALSLSNFSWVSGHPGHILQEDTTLTNGDYRLDLEEGEILAVKGAALEGAPTAFVYYELNLNAQVDKMTGEVGESLELFAIVPVVIVAGLLFMVLGNLTD